ncbi:MAG: TIGR03857 family LLM class F420-dependent oxidoreductase [Acidimicrobiales bacterium]
MDADRNADLNELGFYVLAGAPKTPADLPQEMAEGDALGFGSAFISERYNIKEAATLSGAAAVASHRLGIATGATNHNTRHPLVTASYATTMHRLTGGRFTLGLGRGIDALFSAYGIPKITTAQMEDIAGVLRRLWRGEVVFGHDGPAGKFPILHLDASFDEDIPLGLVAFGPNTLALAGRAFDMVVLHTFFTDETTTRAVEAVRTAAEQAGRDPSAVRIWSCYATVPDTISHDLRLKKTVGRLATYLQGYGDLLVRTNGWDPQALDRFRADAVVGSVQGAIDGVADTPTLEHIATLLPDEWLEPAAIGSPDVCAQRVLRQFDLGVDGVIMHGATPAELAPVVAAYRPLRPTGRFDQLPANPGLPLG